MALTGAGLRSMRSIPTFGTVGAIAEIVDNSIQWKTDKDVDIHIVFVERNGSLDEIMISDNGKGMGLDSQNREIIDYCLHFGGGTNHGATSNLGKFGIGLPYACCSQSENYHVYSWAKGKSIRHKYRDHSDFEEDDIVQDRSAVTLEELPPEVVEFIPEVRSYESGTIVRWCSVDRPTYKKAKTLIKHIEKRLGRIYRHFIGNGVSINFLAYNKPQGSSAVRLEDLCRPIRKVDPLFLATGTALPPPYDSEATSILWCDKTEYWKDSNGTTHPITIKASIAKADIQLPNCKPGGRTEIGKEYGAVQGISLLRANRELRLHHFNFDFPNNRADQRHRWWKIEVGFQPISDDLFGVNANKTDAEHFRYLIDDDGEPERRDYLGLRYHLAGIVQNLITDMWNELMKRVAACKAKSLVKAQRCPACKNKTLVNGVCQHSECQQEYEVCEEHGYRYDREGGCPGCTAITTAETHCPIHKVALEGPGSKCPECEETMALDDDEREELEKILGSYDEFSGDRHEIQTLMDWFVKSGKKHFLIFVADPINKSQFINLRSFQNKIDVIIINKCHPYYTSQIEPLREALKRGVGEEQLGFDAESALESIVLFIISWSDTEKQSTSDQNAIGRFRNRFGIKLDEMLDMWQNT